MVSRGMACHPFGIEMEGEDEDEEAAVEVGVEEKVEPDEDARAPASTPSPATSGVCSGPAVAVSEAEVGMWSSMAVA